jgi:hypothetical protein
LAPFIGAIAYLFMRPGPDAPARPRPRHVTLVKPRSEIMPELPTIVAADDERLAHLRQADLHEPVTLTPQDIAAEAGLRGGGTPNPAAVDHYWLRVLDGPHAGEQFRLPLFPTVVGRGVDCAICLEKDIGVSRHHIELYQQHGQLWLRDLGSRHGTLVNGRTVHTTSLQPGDNIQLGQTILTLADKEEW